MKNLMSTSFKKVFTSLLVLAVLMSQSLTSCKVHTDDDNGGNSPGNTPPTIPDDTSKPIYTPVDDSDLENMSAIQFTKIMGNGINLGNTMEACGDWLPYAIEDVTQFERMWGQPETTKEMFQAMKEAGFDSVRIPIAWTHTMDWSRGNFTINPEYLKRVETVVNYALDSGLFVMINEHWDRDWWCLFSHDEETAWKIYEAIWTQVGNYFKDYDYRLIFEGGNEEHGNALNHTLVSDGNKYVKVVKKEGQVEYQGTVDTRLEGIDYPNPGTLSEDGIYTMANRINQKFVDLIRSQGSKNAKRFLLIPGIQTDFTRTCDARYKMPEDSSNSVQKLMVSVHFYDPAKYSLIGDPNNSWGFARDWGTDEEVKIQNASFYKMKKFTDAGYGVIIGEYACAKEQTGKDTFKRKNDDIKWLTNVLDNCDTYGYCPFMWDCNGYFHKNGDSGLGFTGDDAEVADVYKNRNYAAEKAGTSNGGKIEYSPAVTKYQKDTLELTPNSESDGVEVSVELPSAINVNAGQTLEVSFYRDAVIEDCKGHVLRLYNNSGTMITNAKPDWCTTDTYPLKNAGTVKFTFIPENDITVKRFTIYISKDAFKTLGNFTIKDVKITVQ